MSCEAPTALTIVVFVNEELGRKEWKEWVRGLDPPLSAELLSRWGEGLRSLGWRQSLLCVPTSCCWPSSASDGARAPGQQSSPRRERALPPKTGPAL